MRAETETLPVTTAFEFRRHAMDRMIDDARLMGANAVLGMRFDSAEIGDGLAEIVAYGTAVVVASAP
jgi:uncharacterized protein YbjQ (UPF0145 family)